MQVSEKTPDTTDKGKINWTCQWGFMGSLNQTSLPGTSLAGTCNSLMFMRPKDDSVLAVMKSSQEAMSA